MVLWCAINSYQDPNAEIKLFLLCNKAALNCITLRALLRSVRLLLLHLTSAVVPPPTLKLTIPLFVFLVRRCCGHKRASNFCHLHLLCAIAVNGWAESETAENYGQTCKSELRLFHVVHPDDDRPTLQSHNGLPREWIGAGQKDDLVWILLRSADRRSAVLFLLFGGPHFRCFLLSVSSCGWEEKTVVEERPSVKLHHVGSESSLRIKTLF